MRAFFRQTVADMFGGEEHIPENVKAAMKFEDYDKGKPLTARRIIAVQTEILKAFHFSGSGTQQIEEILSKNSGIDPANPGQTIQTRMDTVAKANLSTLIAQQLGPALLCKPEGGAPYINFECMNTIFD